jgi:hypothetical protein
VIILFYKFNFSFSLTCCRFGVVDPVREDVSKAAVNFIKIIHPQVTVPELCDEFRSTLFVRSTKTLFSFLFSFSLVQCN